jgi:hypothetical protein
MTVTPLTQRTTMTTIGARTITMRGRSLLRRNPPGEPRFDDGNTTDSENDDDNDRSEDDNNERSDDDNDGSDDDNDGSDDNIDDSSLTTPSIS